MKVTTAWTFYDWANSAYALVITAAIFPSYFLEVTDTNIEVGHVVMSNSSLYAYIITAAYLFVAICSPFISGFADSANNKKMMLFLFTTLGSINCCLLYYFDGMGHLVIGVAAFMMALIGFIGSNVFYNAFLPEITTEDKFDSLSARGFSMGYIGSVILLIFNLWMIKSPETFHLNNTQDAVRASFITVGIWWMGFAVIPLYFLPGMFRLQLKREKVAEGMAILSDVWHKLKNMPDVKKYLTAFLSYNAGVQTIMLLAAVFAKKELKFETSELILLILVLQLVAIIGAMLFSKLSSVKGNKVSIMTMLVIWIGICIVGYIVTNKMQFYCLAGFVGLVMGGIQSLSRSTYSKLIYTYEGEETSFFSFYDVVEKVSILVGTFAFGFIEQVTGSMRNSIIALGVFFVVGLILLIRTDLSVGRKMETIEVE